MHCTQRAEPGLSPDIHACGKRDDKDTRARPSSRQIGVGGGGGTDLNGEDLFVEPLDIFPAQRGWVGKDKDAAKTSPSTTTECLTDQGQGYGRIQTASCIFRAVPLIKDGAMDQRPQHVMLHLPACSGWGGIQRRKRGAKANSPGKMPGCSHTQEKTCCSTRKKKRAVPTRKKKRAGGNTIAGRECCLALSPTNHSATISFVYLFRVRCVRCVFHPTT